MNAVLDVHYSDDKAVVSCVTFSRWTDSQPVEAIKSILETPSDYVPGRFFKRELPCLLHVLGEMALRFDTIVIDGYVHLKPPQQKGLGAHLADSLPYRVPIVGVAKNPFRLAEQYAPVCRGASKKPLYVSAIHMPLDKAAGLVRSMHGNHRIPTLIKEADRLCREA